MYTRKSRIPPHQQNRLIEHFVTGTTARASSELIGVLANTVIRIFMRLRQLIASKFLSYELYGEVEADESYFGGKRKGKCGRGSAFYFVFLKKPYPKIRRSLQAKNLLDSMI